MNERKYLILVVEDDIEMADLNTRLLTRQGYDARAVNTFAEACAYINNNSPDLFVLDIMLSDGDGLSLCKELRKKTDAPVLFLTGRSETKDKVMGLNAGGDYYLTKPYSKNEFLAVVQSLLRRSTLIREKIDEASVITRGPLTLQLHEGRAYVGGRDAGLTSREFAILLMLIKNEDSELTAEAIYKSVWKADMITDTGLVRKHISQIKKKLDTENTDEFAILSEYGVGYTFTTH